MDKNAKVIDTRQRSIKLPPWHQWPILKNLALLIIIVIGIAGFTPKAMALDIKPEHISFSQSDLTGTNGVMEITVPIYDDNGKDEGLPASKNYKSVLNIDGTDVLQFISFKGEGKPQGEDSWYWVKTVLLSKAKTEAIYVYETWKNGEEVSIGKSAYGINTVNDTVTANIVKKSGQSRATYKIYVTGEVLRKAAKGGVNVKVHLDVDENEGDSDGPVEASQKYTYTIPVTPSFKYDFSSTAGKYELDFNARANDKYEITSPDAAKKSKTNISSTPVKVDIPSMTDAEYTLGLKYTIYVNAYQEIIDNYDIKVKAYPQPKNFDARFSEGKVTLTWNMAAITSGECIDNDEFEIQRSTDSSFSDAKSLTTIQYNKTKTSYSVVDDVSNTKFDGKYYYRIRRTASKDKWGWKQISIDSVAVKTTHKYIATATARMIDDRHVQITWTYDDGNVWTKDAQVMLTRFNQHKGTSYTFSIPEEDVAKRSYTDSLTTLCDVYSYAIAVAPSSNDYRQQSNVEVKSDDDLFVANVGKVKSFVTSKGYYSDHVELEWTCDQNPIEVFAIRAREYGTGNDFRQIDQVQASQASTYYTYSDTKSIPGVVYEYEIVAIASCGNQPVSSPYEHHEIGFRTPTGDIYGRVTFESGQAVPDVEVRAEVSEGSGITGKAYRFDGNSILTADNAGLMTNATEGATIEAWVKPENDGVIVKKPGMYSLEYKGDKMQFTVGGTQTITTKNKMDEYTKSASFIHVSAVAASDSLFIYINDTLEAKEARTATVSADSTVLVIGDKFKGAIDEVRLWSVPRDSADVVRDYTRYIIGNETGLEAYYTFDYSVDDQFFDISYSGNTYHKNHGKVTGAKLGGEDVPTSSQLGYRSYTGNDGAYTLRSLPYKGNGTTYMVIPRLGIHQFESAKELRLLSEKSQSHTVNFTDKSSFLVKGKVMYRHGTIPVEGVSFTVDGITVMDGKGYITKSDADGVFEIYVPVGTHEVKAVLTNHSFEKDGRITNLDGTDRNYQDMLTGIEIIDTTTVRYIGRVAGGAVQAGYPLGHSLSKNNLADGIKLTLTCNSTHIADSISRNETYTHVKNPYITQAKTNDVNYFNNVITVWPNAETGEFMLDVLPIKYNVSVNVPGHEEPIPGNNEDLDFSNCFTKQYSKNEYVDSISEEGRYINRADSVEYNQMSKFTITKTPSIIVKQLVNGSQVDYFGKETTKINTLSSETSFEAVLYDKKTGEYTIKDTPVFEQSQRVTLGVTAAEVYEYMTSDGKKKDDVENDKVPTANATLKFTGDMAYGMKSGEDASELETEITTNEDGYAEWNFQVGSTDMTTGMLSLGISMTYGDSDNPIPVVWEGLTAAVIGSRIKGSDFVTEGPDELMFVLRDPPGTNSYSFLEKGFTVSRTSTYNGEINNDLSSTSVNKTGATIITWQGVGAGTQNKVEATNDMGYGINTNQIIGGTNTDYREYTTTTQIATKSDPLYVGSNGDVYVGLSTNIGVGTTENITIVRKEDYKKNTSAYEVIVDTIQSGSNLMLVKSTGIGLSESYSTLFAYDQIFIENTMIPKLEDTRNMLLHQQSEQLQWQKMADDTKKCVYVSYLPADDDNFGRSNNDKVFGSQKLENSFDGPSYKIYVPTGAEFVTDTILTLNQSIENWRQRIADNEEQKVKAERINNVSFHAGADYSYTEEFTTTRTETQRFSLSIGGTIAHTFGAMIMDTGMEIRIEENLTTTHGGEFTDEETGRHSQGFVLSESGDDDYLSVDICRASGYRQDDEYIKYSDINSESTQFSTFIFKTKGGATSCPFEDEEVTRYFEPEKGHVINEATLKIEDPNLTIPKEEQTVKNVPSGKSAYITLQMKNDSEAQEDGWFNLTVNAESNPYGAQLFIDGAPLTTTGLAFLVPAGDVLKKTLEVRKGSVMSYPDITLNLQSQCQCDPSDPLEDIMSSASFSVYFTPSATDVNVKRPADSWTYNTKLPTTEVNGLEKHYMDVELDGFDVNYDDFRRVILQYKPSSSSDEEWITLMSYYNNQEDYDKAIADNQNASLINADDNGSIKYRLFMDDLADQRYDLRAVGTSFIDGLGEIFNYSEVHSGIKDMYNPRLFGSAQPANGVLTVNDEIRLNFNEPIAEGLLTDDNFSVTGIRNGAQTDHSVSVRLDGENDVLTSEFDRHWHNKPLTIETWILADRPQDAVIFSQGNANSAIELGITADNHLRVKVGDKESISEKAFSYDQGTWAHVALTYDGENKVCAFYNYVELISDFETDGFGGEGTYTFGASIDGTGHFAGNMHNARIWDKECSRARLQTNSLTLLSGAESNLMAYYPMNEARGSMLTDKAHGANLEMNGGTWVVPEGRGATLNGAQCMKVDAAKSCVVDITMDYTLEMWFRSEEGQTNATLVSNGRGDGSEYNNSLNNIELGFDNEGQLYFSNHGTTATCTGVYNDNNWHHVAVTVNRTSGRAQIYLDGELNTYFDAQDLGGIQGDYLFLGARIWNTDSSTVVNQVDNYFKGNIDEFRLWNLYRPESMVAQSFTEQLDGSEPGLMAYYPFEKYVTSSGLSEIDSSLADAKVQKDPSVVIPDIIVEGGGKEILTKVSAPVKGKGPVSKLIYDFVVNNDALIITLNEPYDRIEKTIVNFTAQRIRDLNGNEIVSPITWSAYIDRNQLKWGESGVSVVKKVHEEKELTVRANNNGGSIQHYTIENMPSWLDVTPSNGTINPVSSIDVTLTVNPSLNIGTYDEVLYLRNDNNVVESLPLTVKVEGERPQWSVNPADYQYNMSIFGKLLIDNVFSSDSEDILAAFNGNECVGVCTNKYYKINDMWYAMLTVYSNEAQASKDLEFRIWDASTGATYIAEPAQPIRFSNDAVIGSPSNPVVFTAKDLRVQQIDLAEGWSWISVNVNNPNLSDINTLLGNNTWTSDDQLKSETDGFVSYSSKGWVGTLQSINNKSMYMVRSSKAQTLDIAGTAVDTKTNKITIQGKKADGTARWNYISYLPVDNMTLKEALAGYEAVDGDIVKSQTAMAMYDDNMGWIGSLEYMESGKGYMLQRQATTDAELQYPSKSSIGRKSYTIPGLRNLELSTEVASYGHLYATNMTAVVRVEGIEAHEGDMLAAYVNGECRGTAKATMMPDGTPLFLMTISGEGSENVDVALVRGESTKAVAKAAVTYGANASLGTTKAPVVIRFSEDAENIIVYPTPFHNQLSIKAVADPLARVDVTITNAAGVRVAHWNNCNVGGVAHIVWDVDDSTIVDGTYIVNVVIDGNAHAIKTVKQ